MKNLRILICDDHNLLRTGIIQKLENAPGIFVVGEAVDGNDLIKKYEILKPDFIITDISMPDLSGTDAIKKLKLTYPDIKVLFISMYQGELYIYYVLKAGGHGLVAKNIEKGELLFAINEITNGRYSFGHHINDEKLNEIIKKYDNQPIGIKINTDIKLSKAEEKILELISDGLSSLEISEQLTISKRTVDSSRSKIMSKFEMKNNSALVKFAILYTEFRKFSIETNSIPPQN